MTEISASTALDRWIAAWLAHQRALGRGYTTEESILRLLQRFIARISSPDLDQAAFDLWCDSFRHVAATTRRHRQLTVRKFCLYRQRTEPDCFVPDPLYFARSTPYRKPVIINPDQIARVLAAASDLLPTPNSPLLPATMRLAVVLHYTAGLRRGELVRLTLDDVEPRTGLLRIRASKFHKSRMVPLSSGARDELRIYLRKRLASPFDSGPHTPLLCNNVRRRQRQYTGGGLGGAIDRLFVAAQVVDSEGRRPRVQDVRHSFAVQALIRWYRSGADVQSNLPKLAMYMGHVSIASTAHYLHFMPNLRALASNRFEKAFGGLIEEMPA
jgi:integrase/recombinase XerD